MTLLQLSYFVSLAETLHYTKTAERLHVSQPSLSYAINELEKDLGVKLFTKGKQSVELTSCGRQYYSYVKKALILLENGRSLIETISGNQETVVRWGYFHSVSSTLVPALINGFRQIPGHENTRFQLLEDSVPALFLQLESGNLDFCFTCHEESWATSIPIAQQPLYLAMPKGHKLASKKAVLFSDFAREPQIMLSPGSDLRTQVEQLYTDSDIIPQIAFETKECNAALQYVALNFGVSVLPQIPVMDQEKLVVVPILKTDGEELSRTIYLTYSKSHLLSPSAAIVKEYIISTLTS